MNKTNFAKQKNKNRRINEKNGKNVIKIGL